MNYQPTQITVPWDAMAEWISSVLRTPRVHDIPDVEEEMTFPPDFKVLYGYEHNTMTRIQWIYQGDLWFDYYYSDENIIKEEDVPYLIKEVSFKSQTYRQCSNCREYHSLVIPEEGGEPSYCSACYPLVVPQGTFGVCTICNSDKEGVWYGISCGHVFHSHCIRNQYKRRLNCAVCGRGDPSRFYYSYL